MGACSSRNKLQPDAVHPIQHMWSRVSADDESNLEFISKLIVAKSEIDHVRSKDGMSPLMLACQRGYTTVMSQLVKGKADVNLSCPRAQGYFPLLAAVKKSDHSMVHILIEAKASVEQCVEKDRVSPLIVAASKGDLSVVLELLRHSADVNKPSSDGTTPLYSAASHGHTFAVDVLLTSKANVDAPLLMNNSTSMIIAAKCGNQDIVNALIANYADTEVTIANSLVWDEVTPLVMATQYGHSHVVKALLSGKADPNYRRYQENGCVTPLLAASVLGSTKIVKQLLSSKADIGQCTTAPTKVLRYCPNKHIMVKIVAEEASLRQCNTCMESPSEFGTEVFGCARCSYFMCLSCSKKQKNISMVVIPRGSTSDDIWKLCGHRPLMPMLLSDNALLKSDSFQYSPTQCTFDTCPPIPSLRNGP